MGGIMEISFLFLALNASLTAPGGAIPRVPWAQGKACLPTRSWAHRTPCCGLKKRKDKLLKIPCHRFYILPQDYWYCSPLPPPYVAGFFPKAQKVFCVINPFNTMEI